jgi:hypothetical protein
MCPKVPFLGLGLPAPSGKSILSLDIAQPAPDERGTDEGNLHVPDDVASLFVVSLFEVGQDPRHLLSRLG